MVTAYSYTRFSSIEQAKGDSLNRQTNLAVDYCKRNNIKLDTSLSLKDLGVSAFTGKNESGALGEFISQVNKGRIPKGSYLLIENLDRLSRREPAKSMLLLLNLINQGIKVVTLSPTEIEFNSESGHQLLMAVMELNRAHSESSIKSQRITKAWTSKKEKAKSGIVLTSRLPAWIRNNKGKLELIPESAACIKEIFRLSIAGFGQATICKTLNNNLKEFPPIGKAKLWGISTVSKILHNPAVYGVYQPYKRTESGRVKDGAEVADYFPPAITADIWYKAKAGLTNRKETTRGRVGKDINLLKGILKTIEDGSSVTFNNYTTNAVKCFEVYRKQIGLEIVGASTFPYYPLVTAVLLALREIKTEDLLDTVDDSADSLLINEGRLGVINKQLEEISQKLISGTPVDTLIAVINQLETEKQALARSIEYLRQKKSNPTVSRIAEAKALASSLPELGQNLSAIGEGPETLTRLQNAIRGIVEAVHCLFWRSGRKQGAFLLISFKESKKKKAIKLYYKPACKQLPQRPAIPVFFKCDILETSSLPFSFPNRKVAESLLAGMKWPE